MSSTTNTCSNYSNGAPPRDIAPSNSTVSGISKTCSLTANNVNSKLLSSPGVITQVIQVGNEFITEENIVAWNEATVFKGIPIVSAAVTALTANANPRLVLSGVVITNEGYLPFVLTVTPTGTLQVDETGLYGISLTADIDVGAVPDPVINFVSSAAPATPLIHTVGTVDTNTITGSLYGIVSLTAATDYQFELSSLAPVSPVINTASFHMVRLL